MKKLAIIHRDLQHIYTGGQYRLAQVLSHAKKKRYNVEVISCGNIPGVAVENRISLIIYFIKYYLKHRDNIFTFTDHSLHFILIIPLLIGRFFGNRYGMNCNQTFYNFRKSTIAKLIEFICEYIFLHAASLRIIPSEPAVDYFQFFHLHHAGKSVIVNPAARIISKKKIRFRTQAGNIIFVGQVRWWKGLDILIQALGHIKQPSLNLDIAGEYDPCSRYFKYLKTLIHKHNLEARITFHGNLPPQDLADLYQKADLLVLSSYYETYGIVLLEALSFGLPIVTSTIPSAKVIVKDRVNGLYYETGNAEALARVLSELCSDKKLRKFIHKNNLRASKNPRTWEMVAGETVAAIDRFLS